MLSRSRYIKVSRLKLVIILVVMAAIAIAVFLIVDEPSEKNLSQPSESVTEPADPVAPEINSAQDLDKAQKTLDDAEIDNSPGVNQLDSELSEF